MGAICCAQDYDANNGKVATNAAEDNGVDDFRDYSVRNEYQILKKHNKSHRNIKN